MDDNEKRQLRIEAKLNIVLRAAIPILSILIGFAVYGVSVVRNFPYGLFWGLVAGAAAGAVLERQIGRIEKNWPY